MSDEDRSAAKPDFAARAADGAAAGIVSEFWHFLRESKKWWLAPIIVTILLLGGLVLLAGTAVGPFIYPLF